MRSVALRVLLSIAVGSIPATASLGQVFNSVDIGPLPTNFESKSFWVDVDNDGDEDMLWSRYIEGPVQLYKNEGGSLTLQTNTDFPPLLHPSFGSGDFNNDGFADLVMSGVSEGGDLYSRITGGIYLNDGTGLFSKLDTPFVPLSRGSIDCADFDQDGDTDLLLTGEDKTRLPRTVILVNNGDSTFTDLPHSIQGVRNVYGSNASWGDFDQDGDADILISGDASGYSDTKYFSKVYVNNGNRTFSESLITLQLQAGASEWVDVNNDGALDIFVSGYILGVPNTFAMLYINDQTGKFNTGAVFPTSNALMRFEWVDFDNDGDKDLCGLEGFEGIPGLWVNNGGSSFTKLSSFEPPKHTEMSVTDFNSDGHYDILFSGVTNNFTPSFLALQNISTANNLKPSAPASVNVTVTGRDVSINWVAATDTETPGASLNYMVRIGTSSGASDVSSPLATVGGKSLSLRAMDMQPTSNRKIIDLPAGTYFVSVQTVDQTGLVSLPSPETNFTVTGGLTVPQAPTSLMLEITQTNLIRLRWIDQANNENNYIVQRSLDGLEFSDLALLLDNAAEYLDQQVELGKTYYYRVKASNSLGSSQPTEVLSILNPKGQFQSLPQFDVVGDIQGTSISVNWADFNGDGWDDLFMGSQGPTNTLYRNLGDGNLEKVGVGLLVENSNYPNRRSCWGDYDNDGDLDVYMAAPNKGRLFRNEGGLFVLISDPPFDEIFSDTYGVSWVDYDNDGFLDLSLLFYQSPSHLYHNNGNGTFTKVTSGEFVSEIGNFVGVAWADYNNDGWQDALALNYGGEPILFKNTEGVLKKVSSNLSAAGTAAATASWGDFDQDGDFDVFVGNNANVLNALFENKGGEGFVSTAVPTEMASLLAPGSSWGDINNDGRLDLVTTGNKHRSIFLNRGDGEFESLPPEPSTQTIDLGESVALADYNHDGFLDIAMPSYWNKIAVLKNNGNDNNWITFGLTGTKTNRNAIGAKVSIYAGGKEQHNYVASQTGSSAQNSFRVHFGLGESAKVDSAVIEWPTRGYQILTDLSVNQHFNVTEPLVFPVAPVLKTVTFDQEADGTTLVWQSVPGATHYVIQRSVHNQDGFISIGTAGGGDLTFSEAAPTELDSAYYRVLAIIGDAVSTHSNAKAAFCGIHGASELTSSYQSTGIKISWIDQSSREDFFELLRSKDGAAFQKIATTGANVTTFTDTDIEEQADYAYLVQAVAGGQFRSALNDTTKAATPLNAPTNPTVHFTSNTVEITWQDKSNKETSYVIERSNGNNTQFQPVAAVNANITTFSDTGFPLETNVFYRVKAMNAKGSSEYSQEVTTYVVGIEDGDTAIEFYPNPASTSLNVRVPAGEKIITLINALGQEQLQQPSRQELVTIDVRGLPAGTYVLRVSMDGKFIRARLLIQR